MYTLATAMVISMLCVAIVYTAKLPQDKPIEMIEAEGEEAPHASHAVVPKADPLFNNNIFDPHEQDTKTIIQNKVTTTTSNSLKMLDSPTGIQSIIF